MMMCGDSSTITPPCVFLIKNGNNIIVLEIGLTFGDRIRKDGIAKRLNSLKAEKHSCGAVHVQHCILSLFFHIITALIAAMLAIQVHIDIGTIKQLHTLYAHII